MQTLMPEDGPFRHLIADTYAKDTLKQIKQLTSSCHSHRIVPVANGLFAASGNQGADSVSGYPNVWARDNVMVANSFRLRGEFLRSGTHTIFPNPIAALPRSDCGSRRYPPGRLKLPAAHPI